MDGGGDVDLDGQRAVEAIRYWPVDPAQAAAAMRLIATDLEWLASGLPPLLRALG